ncbi:hypothetical protein LMB76_07570 [Limosilactobacillus reuteri]|uniref:Uncharacterized protein n=1 Tax=Limosilactobacillus reuteri TaxID=1598 RepID=A0AAW4X7D0_LIMRT|nr:hypothetical protein [Limosilactobacillus reuteri]MCC4478073.1 hypothetical protein [Limosilactobacillus reuteri]MCC4479152.1 hypothetical protein [Limosilactobacillus reuteri]MCC4489717.1 hypothetical protein [Limosilactobacillus reuteri]MCC4494031.1 hypothetical protein [Limosilactobacillus reuteri]MCC4496399.1 hypothetical protein [Limosilactobacillus reuteri]
MDLETNLDLQSGRKFRQQLINNLTIIQNEDNKDDNLRDRQYKELIRLLEEINTRLDKLEQEKATRDELKDVQEAWKKKIEHVALGTDYETVEQAVMQILKEKGMI